MALQWLDMHRATTSQSAQQKYPFFFLKKSDLGLLPNYSLLNLNLGAVCHQNVHDSPDSIMHSAAMEFPCP